MLRQKCGGELTTESVTCINVATLKPEVARDLKESSAIIDNRDEQR